ncbi:MAG: helix-turn-helix transcriptional regulator [Planctomycetes bacterium]|nr:helix-turn-helix transcriptional regulator [Planctomycetota bacterium]
MAYTKDHPCKTALAKLTDNQAFEQIFYAEQGSLPPLEATVRGFPSMVVPVKGHYALEMTQDDKVRKLSLNPGSALLIPANSWFRSIGGHEGVMLIFLFGIKRLSIILQQQKPNGEVIELDKCNTEPLLGTTKALLESLLNQHCAANAYWAKGIIVELYDQLQAPVEHIKGHAHTLFETICSHIQEYYQADLSRDGIARDFGITPQHLSRLFQQQGIMTLTDYITWVRLDRAKLYLTRYQLSVQEIAHRAGFHSDAYFCRIFKNKLKLTPNQYRQKYHHQSK